MSAYELIGSNKKALFLFNYYFYIWRAIYGDAVGPFILILKFVNWRSPLGYNGDRLAISLFAYFRSLRT